MIAGAEVFPYVLGALAVLTFIGTQFAVFRQARKEATSGLQQQLAAKEAELDKKTSIIREQEAQIRALEREKLLLMERLIERGDKK